MKSLAATIIFVLLSITAFALDTTVVKLMKTVVAVDIGRYYTNYYVFRNASEPRLNWFHNDEIQKVLPGVRIEDFDKPVTAALYWPEYQLPGAIYIDSNPIATKAGFKEFLKTLPEVDNKTGEMKGVYKPIRGKQIVGYYVFSKPAFTSNKMYALVTIEMEDAGYCYIMKNVNGNWKLVFKSGWMT